MAVSRPHRFANPALAALAADQHVPARAIRIVPHSGNRKTGRVFQTYASPSTCPPTCPFRSAGCYANSNYHCRLTWAALGADAGDKARFARPLAVLPLELDRARRSTAAPGALLRWAVAGDIMDSARPYVIDRPAVDYVRRCLEAAGVRGYGYSHAPLHARELPRGSAAASWAPGNAAALAAMAEAARAAARADQGFFLINVSCESLARADFAAARGIPAVVEIEDRAALPRRTPAGRPVVLCPAQSRGLTCAQCRLCAQPARPSVVAFEAHGAGVKKARAAIAAARAAQEKIFAA